MVVGPLVLLLEVDSRCLVGPGFVGEFLTDDIWSDTSKKTIISYIPLKTMGSLD